jgi:serine protease Do
MQIKKKGFVAGAVAGAAVAAAALAATGAHWPGAVAETRPALIKASTAPIFAPPPGAPLSFADIFERVAPAVVSIDVTSRAQRQRAPQGFTIPGLPGFPFNLQPPGGDDDDDDGAPNTPPGQQGQGPEARATGSGFFISADGYIVTNNHVVENAEKITVRLNDQRELPARLIGRDEGTDLAVLKVEGSRFPFVNFENDAKPRVGDWVIAVGNPFDLGGTATAGIVSAYGRDIGETYADYLQIDAPINRGNSGGPTFDVYGRVIGVNTAIFSPTGGSVGIGFAIPAEVADRITKQLISSGKVVRGYLGVTIQNISPEVAESLGIEAKSGALVADVVPDGPAAKGGVQQGDIILSVNGTAVTSSTELTRRVANARAGEVIRLEALRAGRRVQLQVTSGTRPSNAELAANDNGGGDQPGQGPRTPGASTTVLGMGLATLDAGTRAQLGVRAGVNGVVITSVAANSEAGRRGLRRGDVLQRVGDRAVATPAEVESAVAAVRSANRPAVLILVNRDGRPLFTALRFAEPDAASPGAGAGAAR